MNDAMEWARIFRSYFWPGLVLLISLWIFRHPILSFLSELESLSFGKAKAKRRAQSTDQTSLPRPPSGTPIPGAPPNFVPDLTGITVEQILPFVYFWYYEKAYRLIFGSQLDTLQYLNEHEPAGASAEDLLQFFERHLARAAESNLESLKTFEDFMAYLFRANLVSVDPSTGRYHITPLGLAFRQWANTENVGPGTKWL